MIVFIEIVRKYVPVKIQIKVFEELENYQSA
jgi:hypothetical protein